LPLINSCIPVAIWNGEFEIILLLLLHMDISLLARLQKEGLISEDSLNRIREKEANRLFSLHWEIRLVLYLGIMLFSGGLGVLIYKNIDTIGHQVILGLIALTSAGCYYYCFRNKKPYSPLKVEAPNAFFDYVLLLASLLMVSFIGYLQFQYAVFGQRFGLATFIPMIIFFITAYYFDHLGVLSLGITNLAAWLGLTVTPARLLADNDFNSTAIIITAFLLGIILLTAGQVTLQKAFKKHFAFTYTNFGMHIFYVSTLAGMFHFEAIYLLWFVALTVGSYLFYQKALREKSFYIIVVSAIYSYIALSYVVIQLLTHLHHFDLGAIYLGFIYFIISGILFIIFLMRSNKKLKSNDRL